MNTSPAGLSAIQKTLLPLKLVTQSAIYLAAAEIMSLCYELTFDKMYVAPLSNKNSQQIWLERIDSPLMGYVSVTCNLCNPVYLGTASVLILCRGDHRLGKHVIYPNCFEEDV